MGKNRVPRGRHFVPKKKKKKREPRPQPNITIKRVNRILQPKVPEDIDLKKLSELYRMEGMQTGVMLTTMLPQKLIDRVVTGEIPTKVETIVLLNMFKDGLEAAHRAVIDKMEKLEVDLEELVGYEPIDEDDLTRADIFVRLITIPEEEGGGFCAELDPGCRGDGETPSEALEDLAGMIDEHLERKQRYLDLLRKEESEESEESDD